MAQGTGLRRSYKFLLRPTAKQQDALTACLEDHRVLYNAALEERREAWKRARVSIRYGGQSAQLKDIRAGDPDQARWSFSSQQTTLRRLDQAFAAFFRRVRAGQKPGYPRFKGPARFDSVTWQAPERSDGCRWDSVPETGQTRVYLKGIGHVRVHAHRVIAGAAKSITVKREGRRWYAVVVCHDVPAIPVPPVDAPVGIDLGIANFLATSDGTLVDNPRHLRKAADKIADAQRVLTRAKRGSRRRAKRRARVSTIYRKVARQRLDHAHKTALRLVRSYDLIAHEALTIRNMTRRPKPRPAGDGTYLPNGAAAKSGLNKSILDAGWGVFLRVLAAKAESAGRIVVAVDPRNTSRTCPDCRHCAKENRVTQAELRCVACGYTGHADVVGAINVLRAGLAHQSATAA